jgi:hypothetical protein
MQSIDLLRLVIISLFLGALTAAQTPTEEADTRGAFLKTRPKPTGRKPGSTTKQTGTIQPENPQPPVGSGSLTVPIGLGYTLFKKGAGGKPMRVPSTQIFHTGDEVRLTIEPNISGYFYVFYTDEAGQANMLFPNPQLNQGENLVKAHVLYEVPSSQDPASWFSFDDRPATQRLYLVISRAPLPDVLIGAELLAACQPNPKSCLWKPSAGVWSRIVAGANLPKHTGKSRIDIPSQTDGEHTAITRGLGLSIKEPSPTMIQMNLSPKSEMLVMVADLIQK